MCEGWSQSGCGGNADFRRGTRPWLYRSPPIKLPIAPSATKIALHVLAIATPRGHDAIRQARKRQRLDPHPARSGHRREEEPFSTEERGLDAADELDVVLTVGSNAVRQPVSTRSFSPALNSFGMIVPPL